MRKKAAVAAAMLLIASLGAAVPVPSQAAAGTTGTLPHGGSYVVESDPTIAAAAVGLWFRAPASGYDNGTPGISRLAVVAAAAAPLASGRSLVQLVQSLGGQLQFNVYPDIVGVSALVPASAAKRVIAGMTAAYYAPAIDEASVKTAQRDAAVLAVQQRYSSDAMLHDLLFAALFTAGPAHYPPLPDSVNSLTHIATADVSAFAKRAFRSSNSVLTLAGNVDASSVEVVTDGSGPAAMDAPFDSTLASAIPAAQTVNGVVDGSGLAWPGPPISDERSATALDFISDYLFRDRTGVVSRALANNKKDAYASGQFITLHDPGVLLVTIGGGDQAATQTRVLAELEKLQTPLGAEEFKAAREAFLYHIASDTETPNQQADNLGWYNVEGNPGYAPGNGQGEYEKVARGLDPDFVASVVRKYVRNPVTIRLMAAPPSKENAS